MSQHPFNVWIMPETLIKLNHYATAALPTEIGGLARVHLEDDDVFVTDVHMFPQKASAATFAIDADDINAFTLKLVKEGRSEEIPQWCSIVHSHPVGMDPGMSGVDVDAIKRFAAEQDAFSLIISASQDASSENLAMHYCTNVRGQKYIIDNIPVEKCYSQERLDLGSMMADLLIEQLGDALTDKDKKDIRGKCTMFTAEELPDLFEAEYAELTSSIKADVKDLVKNDSFSNYGTSGRKWEKNKDGVWVEKKTSTFGFSQGNTGSSQHGYTNYGYYDDDDYSWYEQKQQAEEHRKLVKLANGVNPVTGVRDVSKTQQKKAKKRLVKLAARERAKVEKRAKNLKEDKVPAKVGDYVLIVDDPETIASVEAQCIDPQELELAEAMMVIPSPIDSIAGDLIHVNGLGFWWDELRFATQDEIDLVNVDDREMIV